MNAHQHGMAREWASSTTMTHKIHLHSLPAGGALIKSTSAVQLKQKFCFFNILCIAVYHVHTKGKKIENLFGARTLMSLIRMRNVTKCVWISFPDISLWFTTNEYLLLLFVLLRICGAYLHTKNSNAINAIRKTWWKFSWKTVVSRLCESRTYEFL